MMTNTADTAVIIWSAYENAVFPAVLLDRSGSIVYENKAYEKLFGSSPCLPVQDCIAGPCEVYITANGTRCKLYSTPVDEYFAVSIIPVSGMEEDHTEHYSALARRMSTTVVIAAGNLYDRRNKIDNEFYNNLNAIEQSVMELISQVIINDRRKDILEADKSRYKPISITDMISEFCEQLTMLTADKDISVSLVPSTAALYAKCDKDALMLLMSRFASRLIKRQGDNGNVTVELSESLSERIVITIKGSPDEKIAEVPSAYTDDAALWLIPAMSEAFDCKITEYKDGSDLVFKAELPSYRGEQVLKSPRAVFKDGKSSEHIGKFSNVSIMLTAYNVKRSYGNKEKEN